MTRDEQKVLVAKAIYNRRNGHGCIEWHNRGAAHKRPYLEDADAVIAVIAKVGVWNVWPETMPRQC